MADGRYLVQVNYPNSTRNFPRQWGDVVITSWPLLLLVVATPVAGTVVIVPMTPVTRRRPHCDCQDIPTRPRWWALHRRMQGIRRRCGSGHAGR